MAPLERDDLIDVFCAECEYEISSDQTEAHAAGKLHDPKRCALCTPIVWASGNLIHVRCWLRAIDGFGSL